MSNEVKSQAIAIAKRVNEANSYICGSWWMNGTIAIKLLGALDKNQALSLDCECGESGCGCDCVACAHCVDSEPYCDEIRECSTLTVKWSDDGLHRTELLAAGVGGLIGICTALVGTPVTIARTTAFNNGRCVLLESGAHASAGFQLHANLHYLAAARRYARVDAWAFSTEAGKYPILLGYRQGGLVALVMPFVAPSACKAAA